MNQLFIGTAEVTTTAPFLLIDDDPKVKGREFDYTKHTFNPLKGMTYKSARDFADIVYPDKDLMTYRDGKRALVKMLLSGKRLDRLPAIAHKGYEDAQATIDDLLMSPVLRRVLCNPTNFSFKGSVIARLDRAELGDFDAFILGNLLIQQFQGQVIIPDFGFYGRPLHMSLIRQNRLTAGVNTLEELPFSLVHFPEKHGKGCTYEDAQTLAMYAGKSPGTNDYNDFIQQVM